MRRIEAAFHSWDQMGAGDHRRAIGKIVTNGGEVGEILRIVIEPFVSQETPNEESLNPSSPSQIHRLPRAIV